MILTFDIGNTNMVICFVEKRTGTETAYQAQMVSIWCQTLWCQPEKTSNTKLPAILFISSRGKRVGFLS